MKVYNTLSNKLEDFKSIIDNEISIYVCGPTVYNYPHIGNMRPVVVFDMVHRYFKYLGYNVKMVSNFTDVDDKIINEAIKEGVSENVVTNKYIDAYLEEVNKFNCLSIYERPKVTDYIPKIIKYIEYLISKDFAYKKGNDVYFRVNKIKEYGILSNQDITSLKDGVRVNINNNKEESVDFVLWKSTDKGIKWDSSFGEGRPGWHTECVVMIDNIFNSMIDIHGGGVDLKFPHHDNEIAQALAVHNHTIANYWMHNGHINVDGKKMSKSLNNFVLSSELLDKYSANAIRLAMFNTHYRQPFNLTTNLLEEFKLFDEKVVKLYKQIKLCLKLNGYKDEILDKDEELINIMDNDFNTANVITYFMKLIKQANVYIRSNDSNISNVFSKIKGVCFVLGLVYNETDINEADFNMYIQWLKLKENKFYEEADKLYNKLLENNIL